MYDLGYYINRFYKLKSEFLNRVEKAKRAPSWKEEDSEWAQARIVQDAVFACLKDIEQIDPKKHKELERSWQDQ